MVFRNYFQIILYNDVSHIDSSISVKIIAFQKSVCHQIKPQLNEAYAKGNYRLMVIGVLKKWIFYALSQSNTIMISA